MAKFMVANIEEEKSFYLAELFRDLALKISRLMWGIIFLYFLTKIPKVKAVCLSYYCTKIKSAKV